ncbi:AI-2E family transporter [Microbispora rosea]|uniref:AI-2E family transporter n=1 Tax=Microbispora rosea TaxID=58117 RepID=UPI003444FF53
MVKGSTGPRLPPLLATVAAWCWRLIGIAIVLFALVWLVAFLRLVMLPLAAALLLTALLHPICGWLRRRGLPSLAAAWVTLLGGLLVLTAVGVLIGTQANAQFPTLLAQVQHTAREVQNWLVNGPLNLRQAQLDQMVQSLLDQVQTRREDIGKSLVKSATVAAEVLAGAILMLFMTFFLLKDGDRIWAWLIRGFAQATTRVDAAGRAAWRTLSQYMVGTTIVAAIHSVVMAIVLTVMGVPLVVPLIALIFLASYLPIIGIVIAGGLAVLVTLGTKGVVFALVLLGILVLEQQLENHVLQPLIVGRLVHFHPLAVIVILAVGGIVAGIAGAALAVPLAAVLYRAWPELRRTSPTESPASTE